LQTVNDSNDANSLDSGFSSAPNMLISRLIIYPIKSCAGVALQQAVLTETGLELDRAWMVVDGQGNFLTQRDLPRMALITPKLGHETMALRAPGMLTLQIALYRAEQPVQVNIWGAAFNAFDMGPLAAQWFSDFLGVTARLVRFDPDQKRASSLDWTDGVEALNQFSDGYPLLLLSQASLDGLNAKRQAAGLASADMLRFRPNIVIADAPNQRPDLAMTAHDEDRLAQLMVLTADGKVLLKPVKPCPRCPIPNIDPATAETDTSVGDLLQSYRQDARLGGAISFGMNLIVLQGWEQTLKVGQSVHGNYQFD
jgi:hypothetical protein